MTAGLPGVGIGGMFYLATALLMPFRSLWSALSGRGEQARWTLALRQAALAASILAAIWATGWVIGWVIAALADPVVTTGTGVAGPPPVRNALRTTTLLGSIGTLALVLLVVQVLRMALPPRPTPKNAPAAAPQGTQSAA